MCRLSWLNKRMRMAHGQDRQRSEWDVAFLPILKYVFVDMIAHVWMHVSCFLFSFFFSFNHRKQNGNSCLWQWLELCIELNKNIEAQPVARMVMELVASASEVNLPVKDYCFYVFSTSTYSSNNYMSKWVLQYFVSFGSSVL